MFDLHHHPFLLRLPWGIDAVKVIKLCPCQLTSGLLAMMV